MTRREARLFLQSGLNLSGRAAKRSMRKAGVQFPERLWKDRI
jgi:hypothetical protein